MSAPAFDLTPALANLRAEAQHLAARSAGDLSTRLVFGEGDPHPRLVVVGEAPGATEERLGRPFVGPAGQLLDRLLHQAGLDRTHMWITNVLKVRPIIAQGSRMQNRAPRKSEIALWQPLLKTELDILRPAAVLGLGAVAGRTLVGPEFQLSRQRGRWFDTPYGPSLITFHPSYLLKRRDDPNLQSLMLADLAAVRRKPRSTAAAGAP